MDAMRWRWLEQLRQDARFGVRTLRASPGFTLTAVMTLALATGATTAIFSLVYGVVLRPLPFAAPDRLVQIYGRNWTDDRAVPDPLTGPVGGAERLAYARDSRLLAGLAGYGVTTRHMETPSGLVRLNAVVADRALFSILGVQPAIGRTFRADDPQDVAVIGRRVWRERFDNAAALTGRSITLDGQPFTIVGVMPDSFQFPYSAASLLPGALPESRTDIWVPLPTLPGAAAGGRLSVVARLGPGVSLEAAAAELRVIGGRAQAEGASPGRRAGVRIEPLTDVVIGPVRRSLWMLFGAVGLVLLAACANMANLLLARTTVRMREVVTRAALGASRMRLARQFLAESLILSLAGGLAGVAVARWGLDLLVRTAGPMIPRTHEVALDWQAFSFLLAACLLIAVLFGIAPACAAAGMDVSGVAREAGGQASAGRRFGAVRDALVVVEVALAFVLAAGGALVVREIVRLKNVDAGMVTENVAVLHLTPRTEAGDYYAIEDRVRQLPGVVGAGFIQLVPLQNWGWFADFHIRGRDAAIGERRVTDLRYVTPGYFHALGIPLRRGRPFLPSDTATAPRVVVVNEALARRYFPNEDPVGVELDRGTIIGVVGDVRNVHLDRDAEPELYYPAAQNVAMTSDLGMSLMVRAASPPESVLAAVRAAVLAVNPRLAIFNVRTMAQVVADSLWELNLYRWLIGLFATLTIVLSAIGLYGVISCMASARTREFAIRLALGCERAALGRLVVGRGLGLAATGVLIGGLTTWLLSSSLRYLSIARGPDPAIYATVTAALLGIAGIACALPAFRAAAANPVAALRHE